MTRLPAPAWWQPERGNRSHRVRSWRLRVGKVAAGETRCGINVFTEIDYREGTLTAEPTRPVCRVCEPRRRREP